METFFDRQILLSMRKRMVKEDSLVAESITSNFKYSHQPGKRKKTFVSSGKFITRWKEKKEGLYYLSIMCKFQSQTLFVGRENSLWALNQYNFATKHWNESNVTVSILMSFLISTTKKRGWLRIFITRERKHNHRACCHVQDSKSSLHCRRMEFYCYVKVN